MNAADAFPRDYFAARDRFRAEAVGQKWALESHNQEATGPHGEKLTVDVASSGNPTAPNLLLITSGLHGVEAPLGSAIQSTLINSAPNWLPSGGDLRVCMVHSLNPYAYCWSRRCDEQNIDPNRNFLRTDECYQGCRPVYRRLQSWLNPRRPLPWWDPMHLRALWEVLRRGVPSLKEAIAGGQFEYPNGLFYGGAGPSTVYRFLEANLEHWIGDAARVLHLDFHTGLGRWKDCKLLVEDLLSESKSNWLNQAFGENTIQECDPHGLAYRSHGPMGPWCQSRFPDIEYTYLCAEFGTYRVLPMILGLRAENQAHHWERPSEWSSITAKRRLRELFCPRSRSWRQRALEQGLAIVRSAIDALRLEVTVKDSAHV